MHDLQSWLSQSAQVRDRRSLRRGTDLRPVGLLDLASNDYLDLSTDARVIEAAVDATRRYGTGARASRVVTGTLPVHAELEEALAALTGTPSALVFSSGYATNLAAVTALGSPNTLLILDSHVHASLHDAARLSRSPVTLVPHQDTNRIRDVLAARTQARALVVVESVYSVLGDRAPLRELADLCDRHAAQLLVDEAHGIGVLGDGRGGAHAAGISALPHVIVTATLSKALGAMGGAVLGSPPVREHLVNVARTALYDTALAPAPAAAAATASHIVGTEPAHTARLHEVSAALADSLGRPVPPGPIHSVPVSTAADALHLAAVLGGTRDPGGLFPSAQRARRDLPAPPHRPRPHPARRHPPSRRPDPRTAPRHGRHR